MVSTNSSLHMILSIISLTTYNLRTSSCFDFQAKINPGRSLQANPVVTVAGLFDEDNFKWGREVFEFTLELLNNKEDGWHDDLFTDGTILEWDVGNSGCDPTTAVRAYWDLRTSNIGPPHGIIGARCSSASAAIARIAGLEAVTQVSPSATSSGLSNREAFPYFARMTSPDEAKAMVAMLRHFGWDRVSILTTDTTFSKDLTTEFQRLWVGEHYDEKGKKGNGEDGDAALWVGEVAYSHTIILDPDGTLSEPSVQQALDGVPTHDPASNSRVMLLMAHDHHALPILKLAAETSFQPDTIWVGSLSWVNRIGDGDVTWIPRVPGYIGITPFRNRNNDYQDYLSQLQHKQASEGRTPWEALPDYAAEYMVDSILALAMALSSIPIPMRRNGDLVIERLLGLSFSGISGKVEFTPEGDRRDPQFTILNLQRQPGSKQLQWRNIGSVGTEIGSSSLNVRGICFARFGCGLKEAPSDKYPLPNPPVAAWTVGVLTSTLVLLVAVICVLLQFYKKNQRLHDRISALQEIDDGLVDIDHQIEEFREKREDLIAKRAELQDMPNTWSKSNDTLVLVPPEDKQYWDVLERMRETMPNAHISKLWRIQNKSLWTFYSFHKDRMSMHGIQHNEESVWHGTSSLDPEMIYTDRQDGFMMQFARKGLWGRGIYFARNASYSSNYAYDPMAAGAGDIREREMFLAKLLRGSEVELDQCNELTVPPPNPKTGLKYNTVTGQTGGSQVWIVYENGRAYPDYLVRYYQGGQDRKRTPYKTRKESLRASVKASTSNSMLGQVVGAPGLDDSDIESGQGRHHEWFYLDERMVWQLYSVSHQQDLEKAHKGFVSGSKAKGTITIYANGYNYEVDFSKKIQKNLTSGRVRAVKRTRKMSPLV